MLNTIKEWFKAHSTPAANEINVKFSSSLIKKLVEIRKKSGNPADVSIANAVYIYHTLQQNSEEGYTDLYLYNPTEKEYRHIRFEINRN